MAVSAPRGVLCVLGSIIRFILFSFNFNNGLMKRIEIATPINSWNKVKEGIYLKNEGINPYSGDIFHETPLTLWFFNFLVTHAEKLIPFVFIGCDILTAFLLSEAAKSYLSKTVKTESRDRKKYAKDVDSLLVSADSIVSVPVQVVLVYLLNPYSVMNCIAQTTTVFSNLMIASVLYFSVKDLRNCAAVVLAFATYQSFYPCMLIVPICIMHSQGNDSRNKSFLSVIVIYFAALVVFYSTSYKLMDSWDFLPATTGFILTVPDLVPNIGLFWYFFTEMFEHFRLFFICTFQINAFIYVLPLTVRFRKDPFMVMFCLCCLITVFKSYPSIGDVALYMALIPTWMYLYQYMRWSFIIGCFFLSCSVLGPILWHLWINAGSANANFFFSITLAFNTAQIFFITDLLFAYIKREYHLQFGLEVKLKDKPAKLILK